MKKSTVNEYLGECVEVKLFDGDIQQGVLTLCEDKKGYYYCAGMGDDNYKFRSSHIVKMEKIKRLCAFNFN